MRNQSQSVEVRVREVDVVALYCDMLILDMSFVYRGGWSGSRGMVLSAMLS